MKGEGPACRGPNALRGGRLPDANLPVNEKEAVEAMRDVGEFVSMERDRLDELLGALRRHGFRPIGPTVRDGAIVYDDLASSNDLPAGWGDEQGPGSYRLKRREDQAFFGFSAGPQSWKPLLFPPTSVLCAGRRGEPATAPSEATEAQERFAFIGVRACDLHAIEIQDRVFLGGRSVDPIYDARRDGAFIVAVQCGQAGATCFCGSMGTGPRATSGFDLALTEMLEDGRHRFVVEIGTSRGATVLEDVATTPVRDEDVAAAERIVEHTAASMGRQMDTQGIKELLYANLDHPRWDDVAQRCLACANCTMVCPTCFCFSVTDVTDLAGEEVERQRSWDSCFTVDHSYIHGGSVRTSNRSRYRQWMTHKLATWIDQFETSGCVGCGRCITWCPVGIDITQELAAIRETDGRRPTEGGSDGDARAAAS
jgi:ferredoxin